MDSHLTKDYIATSVYDAVRQCAVTLRSDVLAAIEAARETETSDRARNVLSSIVANAAIAARDHVPICQDTGTVWVCLEVGESLAIPADILSGVDDAVARAYEDGRLRMSVVKDALFDRSNTTTNTPAFTEIRLVPGDTATLHVMLKGGGSDNAARGVMLPPGAGREGIIREVLNCVHEKAANACPPLIIGIGVGGTFDTVAKLAKRALLRPIGTPPTLVSNPLAPNAMAEHLAFESELLQLVNQTGIGPGGLGGTTTALAVHVLTSPCHIAALPLAINMGCCAMRSVSIPLIPRKPAEAGTDDQPLTPREG